MGERGELSQFALMPTVMDKDDVEIVGTTRRTQNCGWCLVEEERWGGQLGPMGMKTCAWCRARA
jgi:hypothetical protein